MDRFEAILKAWSMWGEAEPKERRDTDQHAPALLHLAPFRRDFSSRGMAPMISRTKSKPNRMAKLPPVIASKDLAAQVVGGRGQVVYVPLSDQEVASSRFRPRLSRLSSGAPAPCRSSTSPASEAGLPAAVRIRLLSPAAGDLLVT